MKITLRYLLIFSLIFTGLTSCDDENEERFQEEPEFGWVQFPSASTTVAVTSRTQDINIFVDFTAPINLTDLEVSYSINMVSGDPNNVVTGLGSGLVIVGNTNRATITLSPVEDAVQQLIDGGDVAFDIVLTSASRAVAIGLADGSVTTSHRVNLLCGGEPLPGTYTIDMQDSYGDGWQTTTGLGGDGMTATLVDVDGNETVVEFGMCSPYPGSNLGTFLDPAQGECTGPASFNFFDATTTVSVPAGTVDLIFNFPGDWYGEISFQIFNPNGTLLYDSGAPGAQAEGDITSISYCI